jgi:hypothetical protein
MRVNRQKGHHNSHTGDGGKYRKEQCRKYFFVTPVHTYLHISWRKVASFIIAVASTQGDFQVLRFGVPTFAFHATVERQGSKSCSIGFVGLIG